MKYLQKIFFISFFLVFNDSSVIVMTKKYLKNKFILVLLLSVLIGCSEDNITNLSSVKPPSLPLSEPFIATGEAQLISTLTGEKQRATPLNGLVDNIEKSTFYINDYIEFEKISEKSEDIQFHISTQCIESENQNRFTKTMVTPFKERIYLIEMLPEKIFSYGNHWWLSQKTKSPTCNFHFKATNKSGNIHYFELPHLPIALFEHSWNLSLIDKSEPMIAGMEASKSFPVLLMEKINNYKLVSHISSEIKQLKLICDRSKDIDFNVNNQQQYDLWGLQGWSQISFDDSVSKPCRFLSLNKDQQIVGVSQTFPLISSIPRDTFSIRTVDLSGVVPSNIKELKNESRFPSRQRQFLNREQLYFELINILPLNSPYIDVLGLEIVNSGKDSLYLMLPKFYMELDSKMFFSGITHTARPNKNLNMNNPPLYKKKLKYFINQEKQDFFVMTQFITNNRLENQKPRIVSDRLSEGSQVIYGYDQPEPYVLVTVQPQSQITLAFSLVLTSDYCTHDGKNKLSKDFVGIILEGEHLPIYRVLNNNDFELASQTIIQQYNWEENNKGKRSNKFMWELWNKTPNDSLDKNYSGYYYKNTCEAAENNYFAEDVIKDKPSWYIYFDRSKKNNLTVQWERSDKSLNETVDQFFITEKNSRRIEAENLAERRRQEQNEYIPIIRYQGSSRSRRHEP